MSASDEQGVPFLESVLAGRVPYVGTCKKCGFENTGVDASAYPTADARLRAADMSLRYSTGLAKTIRLEGVRNVAESFDIIRRRIQTDLDPDAAASLISSIEHDLRQLR